MAAKDYVFQEGIFDIYLAKKKKQTNSKVSLMSSDRRPLTEGEQIGIFEHYLRRYCREHNTDTVSITTSDGKKIFEAKLFDLEDKDNE